MTELGRDVSCLRSIRSGRYSTGPRLVAEAAYRRLTTPRGMLRGGEEEESYGLDLVGRLGSVRVDSDVASLPGEIAAELTKDERIETIDVTVVRTDAGPSTRLEITIEAFTSEGPFDLVVAVDDLDLTLLSISTGEEAA